MPRKTSKTAAATSAPKVTKLAPTGATAARLGKPNPTPAATPTKPKDRELGPPCLCGCGVPTSRSSRRFRQGHDGRLKGALIEAIRQAEREGDKASAKAKRAEMAKLGWAKFAPAS